MNIGAIFGVPGYPNTDNPESQANLMVASGVESLRAVFDWATAQPYRTFAQVPVSQRGSFQDVGGVPTSFAATDQIVTLAVQHRMSVLPVIISAPAWDHKTRSDFIPIPVRTAPYASFAAALVRRYGPRGTFWASNPGLPRIPIHYWEVWNEPDIGFNWFQQPWQRGYAALLKAAHAAIKRADPTAKVVLGGLANSWGDLGVLYKVRGARQSFDVVDFHPYTAKATNEIVYLRNVRRVMARYGDGGKPLIAGELSWPSSIGKTNDNYFDIATTESGQARKIAAALPLLAAHRRQLHLLSVYYYDWVNMEFHNAAIFNFSGLLAFEANGTLREKPALGAFRAVALRLEHCRAKAGAATRCA